jgi:lysophospholipase L1-like esterase
MLGDSIAFGYGVRYEDSFPARLETQLNVQDRNASYEVLNASVPSFNTVQEVTFLREEGMSLDPDLVIVAVYWNDVAEKGFVEVDDEGRLVDRRSVPEVGRLARFAESRFGYAIRNVVKRSRLLYFVADRLRAVRGENRERTSASQAQQQAILRGERHPQVERGWATIRGELTEAARLCSNHGVEMLVVVLPMPQTLGQEFPRASYPSVLVSACRTAGLTCVDVTPVFKAEYRGHRSLFIPYDGDHPNEQGHRLIAGALVDPVLEAVRRRSEKY